MTRGPEDDDTGELGSAVAAPRDHALSTALLARVFNQPSLLYFNAVADVLSVREAARRLNVASSAVTRQVAGLEAALGMALFQRTDRRLKLAPAGEILYRHTRRLTGHLEAAVSELDMLRGLKTGSVKIAAVESVGLSFLPPLIADFGRRYPSLHLDVSVVSAADVVARLLDEKVDIGLGFIADVPNRIEVAVRRDVGIGVIMRPDHPLATAPTLTFATCLAHPVAIAKPDISIRKVIEPFLQRAGSLRSPPVEVDSIRMLVELALIGHHVSIMTPIGAQNEILSGALLFRGLADPGLPTNRFGLMIKAGGNLHFAPAVFFDHAKHYFETIVLPGAI